MVARKVLKELLYSIVFSINRILKHFDSKKLIFISCFCNYKCHSIISKSNLNVTTNTTPSHL